jgi:predicted nucleic acid-binding protein
LILLDTDVVVDPLRRLPQAIEWLTGQTGKRLLLPGYVVMELVQGCRSKDELDRLEQHIGAMMVIWPDRATCDRALATCAKSRFSQGLGLLDALVGELAVSHNLPLYTFNQ